MLTLAEKAVPAVTELLESEDDQLLAELGIRAKALASQPEAAASFAPHVTYDGAVMGPLDTVREIGRRLFKRWNVEAYKLACGDDPDDKGARNEIGKAIGLGATGLAAALAATLVSSCGLAPALAAVVATLVAKRVFKPAHEEVCAVWKMKL